MTRLSKFWEDEAGTNLLEYALLLFLVTVGIIIAISNLGTTVRATFLNAAGSGS